MADAIPVMQHQEEPLRPNHTVEEAVRAGAKVAAEAAEQAPEATKADEPAPAPVAVVAPSGRQPTRVDTNGVGYAVRTDW